MHDSLRKDPIARFYQWFRQAEKNEINDPNAMSLATSTLDGKPSVRIVLLKRVDTRGFLFYTNLESRKGTELLENARAALCFHWKVLRRQVRVEGKTERISSSEADAYFASRSRLSQLGAWASQQSQPMSGFRELERRVAAEVARYALGPVPRPPHWSGFRVVPDTIEFWRDRPFRLHKRLLYQRQGEDWRTECLYP